MTTLKQQLDAVLPRLALTCPDAPALIEHLVHLQKRLAAGSSYEAIMTTVDEARTKIYRDRGSGLDCPVCQQYAKVYRRPLTREIVSCLLDLIRMFVKDRDWIECKRLKRRGGDYAKLAYWGLVEFKNPKQSKRRQSGPVRPTQLGVRFALAQVAVPSHVLVYNTNVIDSNDGDKVYVHQVKGFDPTKICELVRGAEYLPW